jgi:hypothetical protein
MKQHPEPPSLSLMIEQHEFAYIQASASARDQGLGGKFISAN